MSSDTRSVLELQRAQLAPRATDSAQPGRWHPLDNPEPRAAVARNRTGVPIGRIARFRRRGLSGAVFAEVDGDSSVFVVEYGDEFEAGAEGFEVLAQSGDADVF